MAYRNGDGVEAFVRELAECEAGCVAAEPTDAAGRLLRYLEGMGVDVATIMAGGEPMGRPLPGQTWRLKDLLRLRSPVLVQVYDGLAVVSSVAAAEGYYTVRYPATEGATSSLHENASVTFVGWPGC